MSFSFPFPGPVPPYTNVPIQPQNYAPRLFDIEDISYSQTTLVTTTEDHDYVIGQMVRLVIPVAFGAQQLNNQTGMVIEIPQTDQVVLNIVSQGDNAFIPSPTFQNNRTTLAQIIAIGDNNSGSINSNGRTNLGTTIPGASRNISPS